MRILGVLAAGLMTGVMCVPAAQAYSPFGDQEFSGYRDTFNDRRSRRNAAPQSWSQPWSQPPPRSSTREAPEVMSGGPKYSVPPIQPETVSFPSTYGNGTVIVDTRGRQLFYVIGSDKAYRYPISVGRDGFQWSGTKRITRVANWPDWRPPEEMRERQPGLPKLMTGGERNPLGAKALYLGSSLYRIHGTNKASTIGYAASSGCFRMLNGHVVHLSQRARVGTKVVVLKGLPQNLSRVVSRQVGSPSASARRAAGI